MRFSKYFCMLCVLCVECVRRVCSPFAQPCIIFYTLCNSLYALIKIILTLQHMWKRLVKEISELSSNRNFFISENLFHLTTILVYIFILILSLFLYHLTAYVFVKHSCWGWPTYLAFFLLSVVAVKMFAFNSSYFQCSPFLITIINRLPRVRISNVSTIFYLWNGWKPTFTYGPPWSWLFILLLIFCLTF